MFAITFSCNPAAFTGRVTGSLPVRKGIVFVFSVILLCASMQGCGESNYHAIGIENPVYKPNTVFESFEEISSSTDHLIAKYRLDTVVNGETDEFTRILLLRHWLVSVIAIEDFGEPYPGQGNVEYMLDHALEGQGYHCAHFMRIQNAVMSAFGYVTRTLGSGPGVKGKNDGHHGINEIWLNQYNKWFLSDAKYDHHFEKDGIPLSALEVRDEFLKNKAVDIQSVKGPARVPFDFDEAAGLSHTDFAALYTWISWDANNNRFTHWPDYTELLIMYEDDFYRANTWYRGGRPHWAYGTGYLKLVQDRDEIYFTPNTISSTTLINGNTARIELLSFTPNLKEYQMKKLPGNKWAGVDPEFDIKLKSRKYELVFRAVNMAGVTGPEHRVTISSGRQ
jgi:hypothetical protein